MLNNVCLIGRLTKNVDLRKTQSGKDVASFTIACNNFLSNGEQQTDFINCVARHKVAENLNQYTKKGDLIAIRGSIKTRNYDDETGKKIYVTEVLADKVVFLTQKNSNDQTQSHQQQPNQYQQNQQFQPNFDINGFQNAINPQATSLKLNSNDLPF